MLRPPLASKAHAIRGARAATVKLSGNGELMTCSTVKPCATEVCGVSKAHVASAAKVATDRNTTDELVIVFTGISFSAEKTAPLYAHLAGSRCWVMNFMSSPALADTPLAKNPQFFAASGCAIPPFPIAHITSEDQCILAFSPEEKANCRYNRRYGRRRVFSLWGSEICNCF